MTESESDRQAFSPRWVWLFLAGPVIWYFYFWIVYLAAEAGCVADTGALVTWVTVGMTGATMVAIAYYTWRAARDAGGQSSRPLVKVGYVMGGFFLVATLFVGVPALVLQPC
jgi:hypothetical protein